MNLGTEAETKEFMNVCVETLKQYPQDDLRTPVFIYERLCSIIYPEENDVGEFFLTLEKDPQQEDFLQVCFLVFYKEQSKGSWNIFFFMSILHKILYMG